MNTEAFAETFARIYDDHYRRVFRYLLARTRRRNDAEELTSEVFATALAGLGAGREPRHMGRWLVGIADHLASRLWRRQVTEQELTECHHPGEASDPADLTLERLEAEALWRCLDALDREHRQVLFLRIVSDMPARQVGIAMGRSEEAVRSLQLRALRALKRRWTEEHTNEGLRRDA
ncbi:MAG TPA: RNA polymerase sigma factor [bacterium]|nr:RNA polymerase sigma factor [bacterium]